MAQNRSSRTCLVVLVVLAGVAVFLVCCSVVAFFVLRRVGPPIIRDRLEQVFPGANIPGLDGPGMDVPGLGISGEEGATSLPDLIEDGDLVWEGGEATGEGTTGPVVEARISNPGNDDIRMVIPCGSVFIPENSGEQRMLVVQSELVTVPAGEEIVVAPYVVCMDSDEDIPAQGSGFALGGLSEGDLLQLARCVCEEDLGSIADPLEGMGVQFAVWMTADGRTLSDAVESGAGEDGAMNEFLGGQFGDQFAEMMVEMLATLEQPAMEWLDRCNIELGP